MIRALVLASMFLASSRGTAEPEYRGSRACKMCHLTQYKSWRDTPMAVSFEMLRPGSHVAEKTAKGLHGTVDYTQNAFCVECHVTGFEKPGGYSMAKPIEAMQGVGCEACHGPGGDYLRDDRHSMKNKQFKSADLVQFGFVAKPTKAQCDRCHHEANPFHKMLDLTKIKDSSIHKHKPLKYDH